MDLVGFRHVLSSSVIAVQEAIPDTCAARMPSESFCRCPDEHVVGCSHSTMRFVARHSLALNNPWLM